MKLLTETINQHNFDTTTILTQLATTHRQLAELKGIAYSIPNQAILVNTLGLQEAQDSSKIENIVTTQDNVYKYLLKPTTTNIAEKEVARYAEALNFLYSKQQHKRLITNNMIIAAHQIIVGNNAGIRTQIGTVLAHEHTGKTVYTPPPPEEIPPLLKEIEQYINDPQLHPRLDPLIKMALIHHQFESIHPFPDGNGRIGRIINIIYLIQAGLLDTPILYLSRYINHNRSQYYSLLQTTREHNRWEQWVCYMLKGVEITAQSTIKLVRAIMELQQQYKHHIRTDHPKIYSQELLNNIFQHPYTKIAFVQNDLKVSRLTASRYLDQLVAGKLLEKRILGRENYFVNAPLVALLGSTERLSVE